MIISIITPVYNPPLRAWRKAVKSVLNQNDSNWEWVIVDDKSPNPKIKKELTKLAAKDKRVNVIFSDTNSGIVGASNIALQHATGEFVAFLDHDDALDPKAIQSVRRVLTSDSLVDVVYTDEDKIDRWGRHYHETRKPIWSPEKLRGQMYIGHLSTYRLSIVKEVGYLRPECEGSQDHDLALRVTEHARRIVRIPEVLYHWRVVPGSTASNAENKPYTWQAGLRAVSDHLSRTEPGAVADFGDHPSHYKVIRNINDIPAVSVIIPTKGTQGEIGGNKVVFVENLLRSLMLNSSGTEVEYVIVYDADTPESVLKKLASIGNNHIKFVLFDEPFNFSKKCNIGALNATNDLVVFLNDDMSCISNNAIANLCAPLVDKTIGITGAKLRFEDRSIQHGGHLHEIKDHSINYYGAPDGYPGEFGALIVNREVSGVTGACMALRREVFNSIGGFSELFPNSYNDVDICNKARALGYRILWLADVEFFHYESKSRVPVVAEGDYFAINSRWGRTKDDYFA